MRICAALFALIPVLWGDCPTGLAALSKNDYDAARKQFSATPGDKCSQFNLGKLYEQGLGVPQDYQQALKWYRLAADQSSPEVQRSLGAMYADAEGIPRDYNEALKWFRLAAGQGDAEAQYNLGLLYRKGQTIPRDNAEAFKWFRLAADQRHAQAQYNLGLLIHEGDGRA